MGGWDKDDAGVVAAGVDEGSLFGDCADDGDADMEAQLEMELDIDLELAVDAFFGGEGGGVTGEMRQEGDEGDDGSLFGDY